MGDDDVRAARHDRWLPTIEHLRIVLRIATGVAAVASGAGLLGYWADDSCSADGDVAALASLPIGVGYLALLVGLAVALLLLVVGVWSDPRGPWWKTLGLLPVALTVTAPAIVILSLACFG